MTVAVTLDGDGAMTETRGPCADSHVGPNLVLDPKTVAYKDHLAIGIATATAADDASLVSAVTILVNKAYAEVESDIFKPGYERTTDAEVAQLIRDGHLALATLHLDHPRDAHSPSSLPPVKHVVDGEVVGCVHIKRRSPTLGNFAMFALDARFRRFGLGTRMVEFAEGHCRQLGCTTMQLEVLVPTWFEHANKIRMQAWYQRLGYSIVELRDFGEDYPALIPLLAGPCAYKIFEKPLV
ncbi:hypothetical protein HIM_08208 [Hirsutella minnesotensis 3608]|uniref:N-acetyltransferase domain-containing protein n=1 Tax=Hirsutella minnesotensis 3608 TaxID=1043627 RepID=A0A0F7ZMQ4_9HYPO|nr:hypothetical protein HIM_08208 [Hirsutella minnesotensis 3608]